MPPRQCRFLHPFPLHALSHGSVRFVCSVVGIARFVVYWNHGDYKRNVILTDGPLHCRGQGRQGQVYNALRRQDISPSFYSFPRLSVCFVWEETEYNVHGSKKCPSHEMFCAIGVHHLWRIINHTICEDSRGVMVRLYVLGAMSVSAAGPSSGRRGALHVCVSFVFSVFYVLVGRSR